MSRYKWVHHNGMKLYDVGILADGTLHNPRGYPDNDVRSAVLAADARGHELRSQAAKKAAETRRRRRQRKVYDYVAQSLAGHPVGPRGRCVICGRHLSDQQSVERGVGSECWQDVMKLVTRKREAAAPCIGRSSP
jgi:gas vesicle protein